MLLHGAVIFLEFFAIKAFLMEWLDKGAPDLKGRLRSLIITLFFAQKILLETNRSNQYLPW